MQELVLDGILYVRIGLLMINYQSSDLMINVDFVPDKLMQVKHDWLHSHQIV